MSLARTARFPAGGAVNTPPDGKSRLAGIRRPFLAVWRGQSTLPGGAR